MAEDNGVWMLRVREADAETTVLAGERDRWFALPGATEAEVIEKLRGAGFVKRKVPEMPRKRDR